MSQAVKVTRGYVALSIEVNLATIENSLYKNLLLFK